MLATFTTAAQELTLIVLRGRIGWRRGGREERGEVRRRRRGRRILGSIRVVLASSIRGGTTVFFKVTTLQA